MAKLFFGNLDYALDNQAFWSVLAAFGGLNAVCIVPNRCTGRSRGFGFASMNNSGATAAMQVLDGSVFMRRRLTVQPDRGEAAGWEHAGWKHFVEVERQLVAASPGAVIEMAREVGKILVERVKEDFTSIDTLEPRNFELLVAELMRASGYSVTVTPPSKDDGYDLFITQEDAVGITNVWWSNASDMLLTDQLAWNLCADCSA
jgi:RNA recognition motif-containing protein